MHDACARPSARSLTNIYYIYTYRIANSNARVNTTILFILYVSSSSSCEYTTEHNMLPQCLLTQILYSNANCDEKGKPEKYYELFISTCSLPLTLPPSLLSFSLLFRFPSFHAKLCKRISFHFFFRPFFSLEIFYIYFEIDAWTLQ